MSSQDKLSAYKQVDLISRVEGASPHRLIQMLYEAAIASVAEAKGALVREDVAARGIHITKAMTVLAGLRDNLNYEVEGQLPYDLDRLYDYMQRRLHEAHRSGDVRPLDEVLELLKTVKSGWDDIENKID